MAQMVSANKPNRKPSKVKISFILLVLLLPALFALVLLALSLQRASIIDASQLSNDVTAAVDSSLKLIEEQKDTPVKPTIDNDVPPCEQSPWKADEDLVGACPGGLKSYTAAKTIQQCAEDCCSSDECITWQYRSDKGCLHGGDVRLGMEKDGVSSWCSDHPPHRWQGQYLLKRANGKIIADRQATGACSIDTWNPNEQPGQCFGLGDVRKEGGDRAQSCMEACCRDESCAAWQWQAELGCFYHKRMHGCVDASDPIVFEPFVGRRKVQAKRTYVDKKGNPWRQAAATTTMATI